MTMPRNATPFDRIACAKLVERLSVVEVGTTILDGEIAALVGVPLPPSPKKHRRFWSLFFDWRFNVMPAERPDQPMVAPSRYTTSLDAAMSLVPEGCGLLLSTGRGSVVSVSIGYLGEMDAIWPGNSERRPSAALAVCIAALQTRMALSPFPSSTVRRSAS